MRVIVAPDMAKKSKPIRTNARQVTEADRFVGRKVKQARREAGLTQAKLADLLGVTFQQIQKYEVGYSRLSAGRVRDAAIALGKTIMFFYEPLEPSEVPPKLSAEKLHLKDLRGEGRKLLMGTSDVEDLEAVIRILRAMQSD